MYSMFEQGYTDLNPRNRHLKKVKKSEKIERKKKKKLLDVEEAATYVEFHPFCHFISVILSFIDLDLFSFVMFSFEQRKEEVKKEEKREKKKKEEGYLKRVFSIISSLYPKGFISMICAVSLWLQAK